MLDEQEWAQMEPLLITAIEEVQNYRRNHAASLNAALEQPHGLGALDLYEHLTGIRAPKIEPLWHHRASIYGAPCASCGKPLRTPQAKMCAACGSMV